MKLAFIEMAGFRGFKDKTRFDFPTGFAVLTGRNGVGKSTVLDAVDFALSGTLSKYQVREAKGGGLNEHIWWVGDGSPSECYVSIGFADGDETFVITRTKESGLDVSNEDVARRLCVGNAASTVFPETFLRTTLIRDELIAEGSLDLGEQARFTAVREAIGGLTGKDYSARTQSIVDAANAAKVKQAERIKEQEAELGRTLTALTEAKSAAERQPDVAEAERILTSLEPDIALSSGDRAQGARNRVATRRINLDRLSEAISRLESVQTDRTFLASKAGEDAIVAAIAELTAARRSKEECEKGFFEARRLEESLRQGDDLEGHMVALLQHGEAVGLQNDHCPLCSATRTAEEYTAALAAIRASLSERGKRIAVAADRLKQAVLALSQADKRQHAAEEAVNALQSRKDVVAKVLQETGTLFAEHGLPSIPDNADVARQYLLQKKEQLAQLERAVYILEASALHDRVTALQVRVEELRKYLEKETVKLTAATRALEASRQIHNAAAEVANQLRMEQFDTVMPLLKELYRRLRPHADWQEIEIDFGGKIRASLNFTVGGGKNPQFVFSSGQRRAAGIAFLLAIHLSRPWCRLQSLLLDDPIQHIDDYRALNLVEVLSAIRRTGRQVIIAVEDVALADLLCRRLRSHTVDFGRRFELGTSNDGAATIAERTDVFGLPREVLKVAGGS